MSLLQNLATTDIASIEVTRSNKLTGTTHYRMLTAGVGKNGKWNYGNVFHIPSAFVVFPKDKKKENNYNANFLYTDTENDIINLLGWNNPSEDKVKKINPGGYAYPQPSSLHYMPLMKVENLDVDELGTVLWVGFTQAQLVKIEKGINDLKPVLGSNDPFGVLLKFVVDPKAAPADKYVPTVIAAKSKLSLFEKLSDAMAVFESWADRAASLNGGIATFINNPAQAAKNVIVNICKELELTPAQLIATYYVGIADVVESNGVELDFSIELDGDFEIEEDAE